MNFGEANKTNSVTTEEYAPVKNTVEFKPRRPNPRREIEDELEMEMECLQELEYDYDVN
jgi:hypothetical protein